MNVTSKAAIAAAVISHGNGGLERLEGMEVVTSTRRKGDRRPSIVLRARKGFRLWNQPLSCSMISPPHKSPSFEEQKPWPYCLTRLLAPLSPSRQTKPIASYSHVRRLDRLEPFLNSLEFGVTIVTLDSSGYPALFLRYPNIDKH